MLSMTFAINSLLFPRVRLHTSKTNPLPRVEGCLNLCPVLFKLVQCFWRRRRKFEKQRRRTDKGKTIRTFG